MSHHIIDPTVHAEQYPDDDALWIAEDAVYQHGSAERALQAFRGSEAGTDAPWRFPSEEVADAVEARLERLADVEATASRYVLPPPLRDHGAEVDTFLAEYGDLLQPGDRAARLAEGVRLLAEGAAATADLVVRHARLGIQGQPVPPGPEWAVGRAERLSAAATWAVRVVYGAAPLAGVALPADTGASMDRVFASVVRAAMACRDYAAERRLRSLRGGGDRRECRDAARLVERAQHLCADLAAARADYMAFGAPDEVAP